MFQSFETCEDNLKYVTNRAADALTLLKEEVIPGNLAGDPNFELYGMLCCWLPEEAEMLWVRGDEYYCGTLSDFLSFVLHKYW